MPVRDSVPAGAPIWIDLATHDQAASRAFYTDLLGWECAEPDPELGGYATFSKGGERVAGCVPAMPGRPDAWGVYLATDDAEKTCEQVLAAGGSVPAPAMHVRGLGVLAIVADPCGAPFGLWQPGTHRGLLTLAEPGHAAWFELHTSGYAQTLQFGRDLFGWDTASVADSPEFRYATGSVDGAEVVGVMASDPTRPEGRTAPQWAVYLQVADVDAATEHAIWLGAGVVHPPDDSPHGRIVTLTDPTGALVKLVS